MYPLVPACFWAKKYKFLVRFTKHSVLGLGTYMLHQIIQKTIDKLLTVS